MAVIDAHLRKMLAALGIIAIATLAQAQTDRPNPETNAIQTPAIPQGRETDIKLYGANGGATVTGAEALEQMPETGLTLWLAGNQFFAMDDVIGTFFRNNIRQSARVSSLCRRGYCRRLSRPAVGSIRTRNIADDRTSMPP
jgi:hypothetical protein